MMDRIHVKSWTINHHGWEYVFDIHEEGSESRGLHSFIELKRVLPEDMSGVGNPDAKKLDFKVIVFENGNALFHGASGWMPRVVWLELFDVIEGEAKRVRGGYGEYKERVKEDKLLKNKWQMEQKLRDLISQGKDVTCPLCLQPLDIGQDGMMTCPREFCQFESGTLDEVASLRVFPVEERFEMYSSGKQKLEGGE